MRSTAIHLLGLSAFALIYLWLLFRLAFPGRRERLGPDASQTLAQRLVATSFESYFWYFVLATFWFQAWYLVALVPLAALDPRPLARLRGAFFTLGAELSYVIFVFILVIYWRDVPAFTVGLAACLIIYALPLFTRTLESWQYRQRLYVTLERALFPPAPQAADNTPRRRKSWWLL